MTCHDGIAHVNAKRVKLSPIVSQVELHFLVKGWMGR